MKNVIARIGAKSMLGTRHCCLKILAAGAVLLAAALPLSMASDASATGAITSLSFDTQAGVGGNGTQGAGTSFGSGGSGRITINGSGFAHDGGAVTITTTAPGVTFSSASESSSSQATVSFQSTTSTPGTYNLTFSDDANPSGIVATGLFVVNPAPSITNLSISTASVNGATHYTEVITGTGFVATPSAVFTSTVNGTKLLTVSTTWNSSTQVTYVFEALNAATSAPATAGTYNLTVTNADGGTTTSNGALTVSAAPIINLDPSAFPSANQTDVVTVNGSGFEQGALVTFPSCSKVSSVNSTIWNSPTSLTVTFVQVAGSGTCNVTVTNPAPNVGNGAIATLVGGIGFNTAALIAPTITATSDTTPIAPGSPSSTVTFTGSGFSQFDTGYLLTLPSGSNEIGVILSNPTGNNGTSESYTVNVATGPVAAAGPVTVSIDGGNAFPAGIVVDGPVITAQSPSVLAAGSPIGTSVTLTGSGFSPTVSESSFGGGTLAGTIHYVSSTTLDFVVTTPPVPTDNGNDYVVVVENDIKGVGNSSAYSTKFFFKVGLAPAISSVSYLPAGTTGVGVGATGHSLTINGSNFQSGAVVGNFKNSNSVADPLVSASVQSVNPSGTSITVSISIGASDTNTVDSFTVTNPDGGAANSTASATYVIIQSAPTVTAVAPGTAQANATTSFNLAGTGFVAGATVTATADGTCSLTSVTSSASISVSCTFGPAVAAAALLVTNPNGGSATSATVLASTSPPPPPSLHIVREKGNAIVGRTVAIVVTGTGFAGKPRVTSTGTLVTALVVRVTAHQLIVHVSVGKKARPGRRTLTFIFDKNKVARVNYFIIK